MFYFTGDASHYICAIYHLFNKNIKKYERHAFDTGDKTSLFINFKFLYCERQLILSEITLVSFDWMIDSPCHGHCNPIATLPVPNCTSHQSICRFVANLRAASVFVAVDLQSCSVQLADYFDLCTRSERPASWPNSVKCSSIRCRCEWNGADIMRTCVWCALSLVLLWIAGLKMTESYENFKINPGLNKDHTRWDWTTI